MSEIDVAALLATLPDYPTKLVDLRHIENDPENVQDHTDNQTERLVGSISEHGFLVPVVLHDEPRMVAGCCEGVDACPHFTLVGGECRCESAAAAHLTHVPAVFTHFEPDQRKAVGLALNGRYGKFNDERLRAALLDLQMRRYDLDYTGLSKYHMKMVLHPEMEPQGTSLQAPGSQSGAPTMTPGGMQMPESGLQAALSFQILFDDDAQQESWFRFLSFLKARYPGHDSLGQRIAIYVAELESTAAYRPE